MQVEQMAYCGGGESECANRAFSAFEKLLGLDTL